MSTHKAIDRICIGAVIAALLICGLFMGGEVLGLSILAREMGYESRLLDASRVHTMDIVMENWDAFLETAAQEQYSQCTVVIDGERYSNVGIRGKGNTSLSFVSSANSQRYSFKLEFDHYDGTQSYHGLDKLSLNNLIQDNTMMKDFLTYQMMDTFGVAAPLCSYVYITINGEDWGLYLAVEGVEESFLQRNYGNDYGKLYKPDSIGVGGEMGTGDAKLQYLGDDPENYSIIFDNAKTDITEEDQLRLITALKALAQGEASSAVDAEAVLRYFVVHNFVVNGDSYTGSMVHNYYLYEENGKLSMVPWDYNLAFGTFQGTDATSAVNDSIVAPLSVEMTGDRPMYEWIMTTDGYAQWYFRLFEAFLDTVDAAALAAETAKLIEPYVEKDPTKFCTLDEFQTGAQTLEQFCRLREQSIRSQLLTGTGNIDASALKLSALGTMDPGQTGGGPQTPQENPMPGGDGPTTGPQMGENQQGQHGDQQPQVPGGEQGDMPQMPGGDQGSTGGGFPQQGGNQVPGGAGEQWPQNGMQPPGNSLTPDESPDAITEASKEMAPGSFMGVSVAVLALGIVIAWLYKRR